MPPSFSRRVYLNLSHVFLLCPRVFADDIIGHNKRKRKKKKKKRLISAKIGSAEAVMSVKTCHPYAGPCETPPTRIHLHDLASPRLDSFSTLSTLSHQLSIPLPIVSRPSPLISTSYSTLPADTILPTSVLPQHSPALYRQPSLDSTNPYIISSTLSTFTRQTRQPSTFATLTNPTFPYFLPTPPTAFPLVLHRLSLDSIHPSHPHLVYSLHIHPSIRHPSDPPTVNIRLLALP